MMKLSVWAKQQGISYLTAWRWVKNGRMPVPYTITPSGSILVEEPAPPGGTAALYARVSSADQKADLDRQLARLVTYANDHRLTVAQSIVEIGSALNGQRPKLIKLLANPEVSVIIVEHRDRLMRFGFEYIEAALRAQGRRLVIIDQGEVDSDLVRDMLDVLTSFCARLYGRRSARNRAKKALAAMKDT